MDNIGELRDALPQDPNLLDLPIELREKINTSMRDMHIQDLIPYATERNRTRHISQNAQEMYNRDPTATTFTIMNERQQEASEASNAYNRMLRVISVRIRVQGRLLRTRNEPPF